MQRMRERNKGEFRLPGFELFENVSIPPSSPPLVSETLAVPKPFLPLVSTVSTPTSSNSVRRESVQTQQTERKETKSETNQTKSKTNELLPIYQSPSANAKCHFKNGDMIKLNVGGKIFSVQKETLSQQILKSTKRKSSSSKPQAQKIQISSCGTMTKTVSSSYDDSSTDEDEFSYEYYESHYFTNVVEGKIAFCVDKTTDSVFVDRDWTYFKYILNYLRAKGNAKGYALPLNDQHAIDCIYIEAKFYNIQGLAQRIENENKYISYKYQ